MRCDVGRKMATRQSPEDTPAGWPTVEIPLAKGSKTPVRRLDVLPAGWGQGREPGRLGVPKLAAKGLASASVVSAFPIRAACKRKSNRRVIQRICTLSCTQGLSTTTVQDHNKELHAIYLILSSKSIHRQ